jgi:hypothetical protein
MRQESGDRVIGPSGEVRPLTYRQMVLAELSLTRAVKHLGQQHGCAIADQIFIRANSPEAEAVHILCELRDQFRRALWGGESEQSAVSTQQSAQQPASSQERSA